MAMIRKSVESKKHMEKTTNSEKHHHKKSKHKKHTSSKHHHDSEKVLKQSEETRKVKSSKSRGKEHTHSEDESYESDIERPNSDKNSKYRKHSRGPLSDWKQKNVQSGSVMSNETYRRDRESAKRATREDIKHQHSSSQRRHNDIKLSKEERLAKLQEMQMDAELHEEQRWKRLKQAEEDDAKEASRASGMSRGRNFLDAAHKSVYGAEKGGSSTIEESVRRRTHYSQRRTEENAFRR